MDYTVEIKDHTLEYIDDGHIYLVDGVIVPSITTLLKIKFGNKYASVDKATLTRAAEAGTAVHEAIERYCKDGEISDFPEVRNFRFLQNMYGFEVVDNEVPVILFKDDEPIAAGRLDLVLKMRMTADRGNSGWDAYGIADIKRTSALDKDYLAYQLNLYRIAYQQCYGIKCEFLRGVHLRDDVRKFVKIPINEEFAWQLVDVYMEENR